MIVVVADTSSLVAALDESDPGRAGALRVLQEAGTLVVTPVLLSELDHVGRRLLGRAAASRAVDDVVDRVRSGRAVVPAITAHVLGVAQLVRRRYAALDLDLTDAVNVVLAEQFQTDAILTLDRRGFRAVRPLTHHAAFRLLPDDLEPIVRA